MGRLHMHSGHEQAVRIKLSQIKRTRLTVTLGADCRCCTVVVIKDMKSKVAIVCGIVKKIAMVLILVSIPQVMCSSLSFQTYLPL